MEGELGGSGGGKGRPFSIKVSEVEDAVQAVFDNRSSNSSAFTLSDVKAAVADKKKVQAERDGLGSRSIDVS